ncbi:MAG TPA: LPS export ABC transporter permease LptG [Methylothermaceae bacterium]|nr:LPS export ABC transporter permease LptG [Methylothermaceae bacterium]
MNILERYLGLHFLRSYLLVLLVLLALFGFLDLVSELSEVGEGNYRIGDALLYVLSTFPTRLLDFSAICTLMGGSLALAALVRSSELLAMRTAGMALHQVMLALTKVVLALVLLLALNAEFVAPRIQQWGYIHRQQALAGSDTLRTFQGFWSRDRRQFLNIRAIAHGQLLQGVSIYQFDPDGRLLTFIYAEEAQVVREGDWLLKNVNYKRWHGGILTSEQMARLRWPSFLTPRQLATLEMPPDTLSITSLWSYVNYLKATNQKSEQYELIFWQRVLLPVSMAVMLLFLLPVAVSSPRAGGFGWQVVFAIVVGVLYFLATQVIANLGLLLDLSPLLTALLPTVAVLLLSLVLARRVVY